MANKKFLFDHKKYVVFWYCENIMTLLYELHKSRYIVNLITVAICKCGSFAKGVHGGEWPLVLTNNKEPTDG